MGWIVSSSNSYLSLVPQNVTIFGDKALKNVIKLKWGHLDGRWFNTTDLRRRGD